VKINDQEIVQLTITDSAGNQWSISDVSESGGGLKLRLIETGNQGEYGPAVVVQPRHSNEVWVGPWPDVCEILHRAQEKTNG